MIRTVVIADKRTLNISISVPENYIGKEIEVIAFSKEEGMQKENPSIKKVSFNALSLDTKGYQFNREDANER